MPAKGNKNTPKQLFTQFRMRFFLAQKKTKMNLQLSVKLTSAASLVGKHGKLRDQETISVKESLSMFTHIRVHF